MSKYDEIHIEEDFWNDFIVEAFEHIDAIESNAMDLEQNPEDMEIIHTMFRAFHTIKGLSGFVEHTLIQEIAHKTETLMDYCRKGDLKVNTKIVDAILKSSDYIKQLCNDVNSFKEDDLVNKIEALLVVLEELAQIETPQMSDAESEVVTEAAATEEVCEVIEKENEDFVPKENEIIEIEVSPGVHEIPIGQNSEDGLEAFAHEIPDFDDEVVIEEEPEKIAPAIESFEAEADVDVDVQAEAEIEAEIEPEIEPETIKVEIVGVTASEATPKETIDETIELTEDEKALKTFQKGLIEKLKGGKPQVQEPAKGSPSKVTSVNEEYMKVANYKIDHLVDMISELIINQSLIEQYVASKYTEDRQLITNMSGFLRITSDLQNLSMSLRMVSLKSTFQKVARIARDTIQELGKNVEFVISGENTEIDRVVTEKLLDPLVHLIKNAISHGVEETSQDRINMGKPEKAKVELCAYSKRGKIFIEIKDDGRGINTEVVYQKALEKGLVDTNRTYSDAEIKEFIMLPGFSTAKVVDNISGRGVGMDVVKTQILKTGGKVDIQSTLNEGSTFTLEVPVNHAIMNGTIIEMNEQHFVVPTINVKEFLQPAESQWISTKAERTMIRVRDNIIPIVPLSVFFKDIKQDENVPLVMILELDQELRAVPITNVINRQEVVVKPVGSEFSHLKYISGMSILGTGRVSLILDIDYLFRKEIKE